MGKYCQNNEEEIIKEIFDKIGTTDRFAVEFGEHPDHRLSNCLHLKEQGWTVKFFGKESGGDNIEVFINAENINDIFKKHQIPPAIDLMSIDIDGMDYYVWQALTAVRPRVVIIEYNRLRKEGIQAYDPDNVWIGKDLEGYGSSKEEMLKLAEKKGYSHFDTNNSNLFFIDEGEIQRVHPHADQGA